MKKLITIIFILASFNLMAQTTYELKYDSVVVGKTTSSSFWSKGRVWLRGLTVGVNTDSVVTIRSGKLFKEPRSAFGGGGTIGYATGNYVGRDGSAGISFDAGLNGRIYTNGNLDLIVSANESVTAATGGLLLKVRNGDGLTIDVNKNVAIPLLATGLTPPSTSGTTMMVVSDSNGKLSMKTEPTGGVSSVSAGLGMSFSTITSTGSVGIDSAVTRTVANSFTKAQAQPRITLTTTGTSGAATLIGNTLNIPQYTGGGGSGTVTSVSAGLGMSFTTITGSGSVAADTSVLATKANTKTLAQLQTAFDLKASLIGATFSGAVSGTTFTASGGFFDTSDMRLKNKVSTKFNSDKINSFSYQFKDSKDNKTHVGYSAQQVRLYMPDAVKTDINGNLSVNYIEVLVNKVSSLEAKIKKLEARK